jgi:hypothetical protein
MLIATAKHLHPAFIPTLIQTSKHRKTNQIKQTPEYLASKATLQAQADQIAYNLLLNPTAKQTPEHHDPYNTISPSNPNGIDDTDTLTPSLVINIFLSVVITGFSVYWALTKFATPDILYEGFAAWTAGGAGSGSRSGSSGGGERQGISEAVRVLLAFFAALAVAVAEAFLYAAYSGKVERAKVKERGLRERKVFVGRVGSDGGDGDGEGNSREGVEGDGVTVGGDGDGKEEIWGKGVNGGVRRRVREKWEKERDGVAE